jgi:hypothetical protein
VQQLTIFDFLETEECEQQEKLFLKKKVSKGRTYYSIVQSYRYEQKVLLNPGTAKESYSNFTV